MIKHLIVLSELDAFAFARVIRHLVLLLDLASRNRLFHIAVFLAVHNVQLNASRVGNSTLFGAQVWRTTMQTSIKVRDHTILIASDSISVTTTNVRTESTCCRHMSLQTLSLILDRVLPDKGLQWPIHDAQEVDVQVQHSVGHQLEASIREMPIEDTKQDAEQKVKVNDCTDDECDTTLLWCVPFRAEADASHRESHHVLCIVEDHDQDCDDDWRQEFVHRLITVDVEAPGQARVTLDIDVIGAIQVHKVDDQDQE